MDAPILIPGAKLSSLHFLQGPKAGKAKLPTNTGLTGLLLSTREIVACVPAFFDLVVQMFTFLITSWTLLSSSVKWGQ